MPHSTVPPASTVTTPCPWSSQTHRPPRRDGVTAVGAGPRLRECIDRPGVVQDVIRLGEMNRVPISGVGYAAGLGVGEFALQLAGPGVPDADRTVFAGRHDSLRGVNPALTRPVSPTSRVS